MDFESRCRYAKADGMVYPELSNDFRFFRNSGDREEICISARNRRGGIPAAHRCIEEASAARSNAYVCQPHGIPKNPILLDRSKERMSYGTRSIGKRIY